MNIDIKSTEHNWCRVFPIIQILIVYIPHAIFLINNKHKMFPRRSTKLDSTSLAYFHLINILGQVKVKNCHYKFWDWKENKVTQLQ